MIDWIISFLSWINQCDDMPPQCYDGTWACTCQSFLVPFFVFLFVLGAVGILTLLRVFIKTPNEETV